MDVDGVCVCVYWESECMWMDVRVCVCDVVSVVLPFQSLRVMSFRQRL
ncbi:MAG TPA: hypothetical protein V6C97_27435 [Oculatellaceae cyanobacterium]